MGPDTSVTPWAWKKSWSSSANLSKSRERFSGWFSSLYLTTPRSQMRPCRTTLLRELQGPTLLTGRRGSYLPDDLSGIRSFSVSVLIHMAEFGPFSPAIYRQDSQFTPDY